MSDFNPQTIAEMFQRIAQHGLVDHKTGAIHGTERIVGYVAKVHESGELAGTIDVQEYIDYDHQTDIDSKVGYHEGVYISAIQNSDCYVLIPKLYSEVVIVRDVTTRIEYVTMFSHVDTFKVDAHENIIIGVSEREEFNPDDDAAPDVDELPLTGLSATTAYTKDSISTAVTDSKKTVERHMDAESYSVDINGKTSVKLTENEVDITRGTSSIKLTENAVELGAADDQSVLGNQLMGILKEILAGIQAITVGCSAPGNPSSTPVNFATFQAIDARLNTILSQSVKLKK